MADNNLIEDKKKDDADLRSEIRDQNITKAPPKPPISSVERIPTNEGKDINDRTPVYNQWGEPATNYPTGGAGSIPPGIWGDIGNGTAQPTPPPSEPSTGTGDSTQTDTTGPEQTTEAKDPRNILNQMIDDPSGYLKDNNLNQQYTQEDIYERDSDGNVVTDADGNPVIRQDLDQDPSQYQLGKLGDANVAQGTASDPVEIEGYTAALIDPDGLTKALDEIEKLDPMKAASMSEHLNGLLEGMESGNVPLWARPAVAKVEQALAGRGISASSIGRDSLFNAIIQAAMPIAQQDAAFEQESYKTNYQAKVQAIMSDVNMEFAAKQFNANSQNQANQFKAQMQAQADMQAAARQDAMSQFNAGQENSMTQMQMQLQNQRDQFNSQMAAQIEQANVNWRRQINTQNTAGINAVNQANVQNAFNLSNQALTFLWQEMRDEAQWEFQATQAELDRKVQLEAQLLANETAMGGEVGKTIEQIINGTKLVSGFLDSWK